MGPRLRNLMLVLLALALAAGATWAITLLWTRIGGGPMTLHGWIALGLGLTGTIVLATVLMVLAFRSDSGGWDARVDNSLDPGRPENEDDDGDRP